MNEKGERCQARSKMSSSNRNPYRYRMVLAPPFWIGQVDLGVLAVEHHLQAFDGGDIAGHAKYALL